MLAELARRLGGQRVEAAAGAQALPPAAVNAAPVMPLAPIESRLAQHPRLRKVARNFALQLPAKLQAMRAAAADGNWVELAPLAHWLKGAGGTVGFDAFFEPSRDLEQHALRGDFAAVDAALTLLERMAERIVVPAADAATPAQVAA
jgi:HPt (histidine-containing phosphotransfer) domain-containing protein